MVANDQQRRFGLDDRGYITDKANPGDGKKYKYHGEPNPSDKDVRGYILRRRLKHLVRKLIVGSKAEHVRRSLVAMLLAAIEASQLNSLDPSLSIDHPFKGRLRKKKGMRDYTSISLFIRDVERLLRELYGNLDSEALEELLHAIRFIVVEFATYVSPDLGQECSYASDYDCANYELRLFAEKALTVRVVQVSSNPDAHGHYTNRFIKALAKYWLDDLDLDFGKWDLSRKDSK